MYPNWKRLLPATALLTALTFPAASTAARADTNPYARGPAPTQASITADQGPFATAQVKVPAYSAAGFVDGTIYYPTDTSQGTFGAVVVMPGFLSVQSQIAWYGPRLASQGFVVMTMDSYWLWDQPDARGNQMRAALKYLTASSPIKNEIDPARLAVMGWSMGGGGVLEAEAAQPSIKAGVALAPWDLGTPHVTSPTMIIGATGDLIAPVGGLSEPLYQGIQADRALIELEGGTHFTFTQPQTAVAEYSIAWLKRFVDNDTRYDQFLCPTPSGDPGIAKFEDTCPF